MYTVYIFFYSKIQRGATKMALEKKYLVTGMWMDKVTGVYKSKLAEINSGVSKATGGEYGISDSDSSQIIESGYPIGTILTFSLSLSHADKEAI